MLPLVVLVPFYAFATVFSNAGFETFLNSAHLPTPEAVLSLHPRRPLSGRVEACAAADQDAYAGSAARSRSRAPRCPRHRGDDAKHQQQLHLDSEPSSSQSHALALCQPRRWRHSRCARYPWAGPTRRIEAREDCCLIIRSDDDCWRTRSRNLGRFKERRVKEGGRCQYGTRQQGFPPCLFRSQRCESSLLFFFVS